MDIVVPFPSAHRFQMEYLHQSPNSFLIVMDVVLTIDRDRHLPISEYPVLIFIQRLNPFGNLLILNLSVAWRPFQPFVIGRPVYM